jgi:hypothetical protein
MRASTECSLLRNPSPFLLPAAGEDTSSDDEAPAAPPAAAPPALGFAQLILALGASIAARARPRADGFVRRRPRLSAAGNAQLRTCGTHARFPERARSAPCCAPGSSRPTRPASRCTNSKHARTQKKIRLIKSLQPEKLIEKMKIKIPFWLDLLQLVSKMGLEFPKSNSDPKRFSVNQKLNPIHSSSFVEGSVAG